MYAEVAKIHSKNKSTSETVKKEEEMFVSFAVIPQPAKLMVTVSDKC